MSGGSYDAAARRSLAAELGAGQPPRCPVCAVEVSVQPVEPTPGVSYVRRRVLVICPSCRRSAALDVAHR